MGGNISLAQAYIAGIIIFFLPNTSAIKYLLFILDITNEKDRSKGFGVLGAAFGLAFIVGPATGNFFIVHSSLLLLRF